MNFAELISRSPSWLCGTAPMNDVVVSSRVRLARNLAGMPFLTRCTATQVREIARLLREMLLKVGLGGEALYVDVNAAEPLNRQMLVERHLISRQHAEGAGPRGVAVAAEESIAVMVNEEDHLRVQVLRGGLQLDACHGEIRRVDEMLESRLDFAFSSRFGYLTACPTNVGTGLRVSVMMHLPGLKMTGQLEKALRAARDMHLAVRGLYGEGTEAIGDMFQVSNQTTLGKSEEDIIADFRDRVLPALISYERRAREVLLNERRLALDDKVHRALATLAAARLISAEETLYLFSQIRLGINLGLIEPLSIEDLSALALRIQPAHLQRTAGREMSDAERDEARARLVRDAFEHT